MRRRTIVINSVLAVAVLGVAAGAGLSISNAGARTEPTGQTVAVQRGTVTATVSATGNVEAGTSVSVDLSGSGGTVRKIYVREGQQVKKGDRLLTIDDSAARRSLQTAKASLASAEAQLETATQGRSAADRRVDDASVRSAQTALDNARTGARHAQQSYEQDKQQQNDQVSSAETAVGQAEDRLAADQRKLAAAQSAGDQAQVATLQSAVASDQTSLSSAQSSLKQAKQTRDKTLLADRQAIQTQNGQVASAQDTLTSQTAQRAANAQPARQGAVDSAQAQVDSAQVSVDGAEADLANTTLKAPVDGTVVAIAAIVGQSSSGSGASSSGGSSSGATSSTGAGATESTSSASTAGTSSGLFTLATTNVKQVSASVAEADVVKVRSGQSAAVQFPASSQTLSGKVTAVAAESSVTNNVVQYKVTVSLPSAGSSIRLGQTADVVITTSQHTDALYVPTSAVTTTADGHTAVTRRAAGTDSVVQVKTGLVGAVGTEIVAGLTEGDLLVLPTGNNASTYTFPGAGASSGSSSSASPGSSASPR